MHCTLPCCCDGYCWLLLWVATHLPKDMKQSDIISLLPVIKELLLSNMPGPLQFEGLLLRPVFTRREVNYEVTDTNDYVCRLVPCLYGFELSPLDRALGNDRMLQLLPRFTAFILQQDA